VKITERLNADINNIWISRVSQHQFLKTLEKPQALSNITLRVKGKVKMINPKDKPFLLRNPSLSKAKTSNLLKLHKSLLHPKWPQTSKIYCRSELKENRESARKLCNWVNQTVKGIKLTPVREN